MSFAMFGDLAGQSLGIKQRCGGDQNRELHCLYCPSNVFFRVSYWPGTSFGISYVAN